MAMESRVLTLFKLNSSSRKWEIPTFAAERFGGKRDLRPAVLLSKAKKGGEMRYLDPKNDLTFKKVFGEHPDLVVSFLNAMLPFENEEEEIQTVEYLTPELVPENLLGKNSIVDVRCQDGRGRQFIVEMQMLWTSAYKQPVLFNASKAYVRQIEKGRTYDFLQPVYSLSLLNDTFSEGEEYYHDFRIVEMEGTHEVIEGLRFVFVELPKFQAKTFGQKRMQVLWLRYLTEIDENTEEVSSDLLSEQAIRKAVEQLEESAFSEDQMYLYEMYWDSVSTARTMITGAQREAMNKGLAEGLQKGLAEGMQKGLQQGIQRGVEQGLQKGLDEGLQKGREEERLKNARNLKQLGVPVATIAQATGLSLEEVEAL